MDDMRKPTLRYLPVLLLLALPAAAQDLSARFPAGSITTREQAEAALEAARQEQARLDKEFAARDAECYRKFLVNDCRETVRRERELARREVRRVELEAGDTRRLLDQQESEQRRAAQREAQERQREDRAAGAAQPKTGSASKPLTDEQIERNRAEYEAKQKAHAERLAKEQADAGTRAQNAEAYRQKQADAAKRAADNEVERKQREQRRARRAEELKQKEAEREAIRQRAAEAAAGASVR